VTLGYLERLAARSAATGTVLCLGLDPDPDELPPGFARDVRGVEAFCRLLLETCLPVAAAVKPNLAFFEALGPDGIAALERIRAVVPADVPFIADAKRGDIGSTAAHQAIALFDRLGADAITASPYLGSEAIGPLLARAGRFTYVLCRTSNPGAGELQDLVVGATRDGAPAERLYERVARLAASWGPGGTVGLVVGATAPDEMARIREVAPWAAFLVPGVGAQGGAVEPVLRYGPATGPPAGPSAAGGLLVNVSRGISRAATGGRGVGPAVDPGAALDAAARDWAGRLAVLV
jgi:orotidine 5'-phosphate decarboxylase subfamily 2